MKVTLNRQKLGVEDLEIGLGTVSQTRGGETVIITKIGLESLLATANVVVNTLPAGSDATVEISGADLIFGIPEGATGESLTMTSVVDNLDGTFTWYFSNSTSFITPSLIGLPGKSTYEVAVDGGFVGTEADWLLYLEATSRVGNATGNTVGNTIGNTDGNTTGNTVGNTTGNTDGNTTGNTVGNTTGNTPAHIWDGTSLSFSTNDAKDEFGSSVDLVGLTGNGIASVTLTNTVGGTKTYTITFTDTSTTTFDVVNGTNGADGQDVDHVSKTAGTGAAGTTDTYTVWLDAGETISAGTFNVYNGADGLGSGDMLKATYDTTNNGVVDNAEKVNGLTVETAVPVGAVFTDTVYDDTDVVKAPLGKLPAIDGSLLTGMATAVTVNNTLTSTSTTEALSAAQGKALQDGKAAINQTMYIGTTAVAINRATAALTLAGLTLTTPNIGAATGTSFNSITGLSSITPAVNGTAAVGTGTTAARGDHVHPSDTSRLALTGGIMTGAVTSFRETKIAMGANDINLASGNLFTKTISAATTLTMSNKPASGQVISFILELTNAGSAVITWFSGVKWAGGTAPTLTTAGKDILGCYSHDGGLTWNVLVLGKDVK